MQHFLYSPTAPGGALTPEEQALFLQKLGPLLARQTALYTMDESTSVPVEIAERLLASLCFTLGAKDDASIRTLLAVPDWEAALARGRKRIEAHTRYGKALWQMLCQNLPPIQNDAMLDTLKGIGTFFRMYDIRYFAADIPMDTLIDYPLSSPVPETLEGIAYINEYLRRFALEACLLRLFPAKMLTGVMDAACRDWADLPVSLYFPVADQAVGLALAGRTEAFWAACTQGSLAACSPGIKTAPHASGKAAQMPRGAKATRTSEETAQISGKAKAAHPPEEAAQLPGEAFALTKSDCQRIAALLEPLPRPQALQTLAQAAEALCRHPALKSAAQRRYLTHHAQSLYPRLEAALPKNTLEGIFPLAAPPLTQSKTAPQRAGRARGTAKAPSEP